MRRDIAMAKRAVHSTKKRQEHVTQLVRPPPPGEGRGEGSRVMRTDVAMVDSPTKRAVHSTKKRPEHVTQLVRPLPPGEGRGEGLWISCRQSIKSSPSRRT